MEMEELLLSAATSLCLAAAEEEVALTGIRYLAVAAAEYAQPELREEPVPIQLVAVTSMVFLLVKDGPAAVTTKMLLAFQQNGEVEPAVEPRIKLEIMAEAPTSAAPAAEQAAARPLVAEQVEPLSPLPLAAAEQAEQAEHRLLPGLRVLLVILPSVEQAVVVVAVLLLRLVPPEQAEQVVHRALVVEEAAATMIIVFQGPTAEPVAGEKFTFTPGSK